MIDKVPVASHRRGSPATAMGGGSGCTARSSTPDHPKEVGMWKPRRARRLPVLSALIAGSALALAVPALTTTASAATGAAARPRPVLQQGYGGGVAPNKLGELDCNGFSPIQH